MGKLWIGTSGWSYQDWVGPFYPKGMGHSRWFSHYCAHFQTVELNVTFYRIPTAHAVANWRDNSPADFEFAIKMNRQVTHIRRLAEAEDALDRFLQMADGFGSKLKVILIQLPPSLAYDAGTVEAFLGLLRQRDSERRYAIEFRHPSWFQEQAYKQLRQNGIGCCIADTGGPFPPYEVLTAPYVYVRFHGPGTRYASKYSDEELAAAAGRIRQWSEHRDIYCYFNNDTHGYGIENAFKLREMLSPLHVGRAA